MCVPVLFALDVPHLLFRVLACLVPDFPPPVVSLTLLVFASFCAWPGPGPLKVRLAGLFEELFDLVFLSFCTWELTCSHSVLFPVFQGEGFIPPTFSLEFPRLVSLVGELSDDFPELFAWGED